MATTDETYEVLGWYQAAYDFEAENEAELTLHVGDVVEVYAKSGEWWEGCLPSGEVGLFPANHVVEYQQQHTSGNTTEAKYSMSVVPPQSVTYKPGGTSSSAAPSPAVGGGARRQQQIERPKSETFFGQWSTQMALFSGVTSIVLGVADMIWGVKRDILSEILIGLYCVIVGVCTIAYERTWGQSRIGTKVPWRAMAYFALSIPMFLATPSLFGGLYYLFVAMVNATSAYLGEEYAAPEKRSRASTKSPAKQRDPNATLFDEFVEWALIKKRQNQVGTLVFLFLYVVANFVVFFNALAVWIEKNNDFRKAGVGLSDWAPFAKAFGNFLDFNCAIIVVPVLRTLIRMLYNVSTRDQGCVSKSVRSVLQFVPLDQAIEFHKLVAKMCLFGAGGHTGAHLLNFVMARDATVDRFGWFPWVSGGIVLVAMLFIYSAAWPTVKAGQFEIFWYSHHAFILYFTFILFHGADGPNPNFWKWFLLPGTLYLIERGLRWYRANQDVVLLSVTNMRPNVIALEFAKDQGGIWAEGYADGQYVFIKCPYLSQLEWHPFTISSAPEQDTVTLHIMKCGPGSWTQNLADYLGSFGNKDASRFELSRMGPSGQPLKGKIVGPDGNALIQVDGPHAAPTQHMTEYSTVMVIGGGIGVTPVAATCKSVVLHRWKYSIGQSFPDNAYFFWACRHSQLDSFRWLIKAVKDCEDEMYDRRAKNAADMQQKRFEFHFCVSRVPKNAKPAMLSIPSTDDDFSFWGAATRDENKHEIEKYEAPFSALTLYSFLKCPLAREWVHPDYQHLIPLEGVFIPESNDYIRLGNDIFIHEGRPNWDRHFTDVSNAHPKGDIGVAFCGNPAIAESLKQKCFEYTDLAAERTFKLHKENF